MAKSKIYTELWKRKKKRSQKYIQIQLMWKEIETAKEKDKKILMAMLAKLAEVYVFKII